MTKDKMFFGALILVTALPLFGLPLALPTFTLSLPVLIAITSYWHVASTAFSYFDPKFVPLVKAEPARFLWPVLALPAGMIGLYWIDPAAGRGAVLGYMFWQAYHYQRQNYGLCAFAAGGRMPNHLSLGLTLAAIGGTLGLLRFPSLVQIAFPAFIGHAAIMAGVALYCLSAIIVGLAVLAEPKLRKPRPLTFIAMSWGFFLPSLICADPMTAFWSYAIAHGAQYLICQGLVVIRSRMPKGQFAKGVGVVGVLGIFGWAAAFNPVIAQAWFGLVMVHFLADAKLWRLREPAQRAIIRERFDFLFAH